MFNIDLTGVGALAIPVIIAIVQALKMVGLKGKFAPLVAIGIGVIISLSLDYHAGPITQTVLAGVVYGLSASGLYSGTKETDLAIVLNKYDNENDEH